jgi:hypothetical protein
MNPERVAEITRALQTNAEQLSQASRAVQRAAVASLNPLSYGLQPGAFLIAPWSIIGTQLAAARVRDAATSASALTLRLHAEITKQLRVSEQTGGATGNVSKKPSEWVGTLPSPTEVEKWLIAHAKNGDPDKIEAYWNSLTAAQRAELIKKYPLLIGNADGIPMKDRILANQEQARQRLDAGGLGDKERSYLESVANGTRRLVIYDAENQRIVEMVGNFDENTNRVITYVPGTDTNMDSYYNGDVQKVSTYLTESDPNKHTVAFVIKDGEWADWGYFQGKANNDRGFTDEAGQKIANFQNVVLREDNLRDAEQVAIAHSWGMSALSSSEVNGAHYDTVISLSGAWLADDWKPGSSTTYSHYQYGVDVINYAEVEGDYPHENDEFVKYGLTPNTTTILGVTFQNELDNHGRSSGGADTNLDLLLKVRREIYG